MARHFCASVFVINPLNKKLLLVKHQLFDKWVQPGGHIEDNEFPEEAAVREVFEETGLKISLLGERFPREDDFVRPLGIQKNRTLDEDTHVDIIYAGIPNDPNRELVISDESSSIGWFSREEIEKMDVFPDVKITMDYIIRTYFGGY
jgi:8-oxo-dGTP pyrophosphatase MutT (NUDIX family)